MGYCLFLLRHCADGRSALNTSLSLNHREWDRYALLAKIERHLDGFRDVKAGAHRLASRQISTRIIMGILQSRVMHAQGQQINKQ
jgi:hypothetical protein